MTEETFRGRSRHVTDLELLVKGDARVQVITLTEGLSLELPNTTDSMVPGSTYFYVIIEPDSIGALSIGTINPVTLTPGQMTKISLGLKGKWIAGPVRTVSSSKDIPVSPVSGNTYTKSPTKLAITATPPRCKPAPYMLVNCIDDWKVLYIDAALSQDIVQLTSPEIGCWQRVYATQLRHPVVINVLASYDRCIECTGEPLPPDGGSFPCLDSLTEEDLEDCMDDEGLTEDQITFITTLWNDGTGHADATIGIGCLMSWFGIDPWAGNGPLHDFEELGDCTGSVFKFTTPDEKTFVGSYTGTTTTCDGEETCVVTIEWLK